SPYPPNKTDTYPNSRPTLSLAVDRYIIISLVCFSALPVYLLRSSLPDLFSFHK
ncbi:hypothetical protein HOY80DRAFT_894006, partial [Tuber brumale]